MLKKFCLFFILILSPHLAAMEKEYERESPKKVNFDTPTPDLQRTTSNPKILSRQNSLTQIQISPRSENAHCAFLQLPEELLLLIILELLEQIDMQLNDSNFNAGKGSEDRHDFLKLKKVYFSMVPFRSSCEIINRLMEEGIFSFYMNKLQNYNRSEKIDHAQESYKYNCLSLPFFLTSLLHDAHCEGLFDKYKLMQKFVSNDFLSLTEKSLKFSLSDKKRDNKRFKKILIELCSSDGNLITLDSIFQNVLLSQHNKKILKTLVNDKDIFPNNYVSTKLMRYAFNGDIDSIKSFDTADAFIRSKKHFTPIIWAIIGGNENLLDIIFSELDIEQLFAANELSQNLIHFSVFYASLATLNYLLVQLQRLDPDIRSLIINLPDNNNHIPLYYALENDVEEKTLALLNCGARLDLLNGTSLTYKGKSDMLRYILQDRSAMRKIASKLLETCKNQNASPQQIITCCIESHKDKRNLLHKIWLFGCAVFILILYGSA